MPFTNPLLILLTPLFLLSACTTQQVAPDDAVQACIDKLPNSQLIKKQAVTTGCVVSAIMWKAIGVNNPASLVCLAGGGAGFLIGKSIAERKCSYRTAEEKIAGEIAHAKKSNSSFPVFFADKSKKLIKQKATVTALMKKLDKGNADIAQITVVQQAIVKAATTERELVGGLNKEIAFKQLLLADIKRRGGGEKEKNLQKEIALLYKNIKILREENKKIYLLENQLAKLPEVVNKRAQP